MKFLLRRLVLAQALALALVGVLGCREEPPPPPVPLSVLATASMADLAAEAARAFEGVANVEVDIRTGGTPQLAEEIASTPSADVFLAADTGAMDRLARQGLVVPESRWQAVGNRMVILGRDEAAYPPVRFVEVASLGFRRFVVADPRRDPAGRYARRWLESVGARGDTVWRQVASRRETVGTVNDVLGAVGSDPSAVGVVFATDITRIPNGKVLFRSPDVGIRYSFALVDRPGRPPEAQGFLTFLKGPEGIDLLQRHGFLVEPVAQP